MKQAGVKGPPLNYLMFEGLKIVWEQYLDYYKNTEFAKRGLISKEDLNVLKTWLTTSVVPFNGFVGKIYFTKMTTFPRYKFAEYSRNNNQIVRRVRDIDNSNAIVIDTKELIEVINSSLRYMTNWKFVQDNYNSTGQPVFTKDKLGDLYYQPHSEHNRDYTQLEFLTYLYTNYLKKNFKIITVQDLSQSLGKQYEAINVIRAEQLSRLFESKGVDDVKLAMEVMTNCDLEASYFHCALMFGKYGHSAMKYNGYWNSTSFKTFRESFDKLGLRIDNLFGMTPISVTTKYLKLENKYLFEEDVEYIKKLIKEDVEKHHNFEFTGYKLNNYEIEIKIDPSKIISNIVNTDVVDASESVESIQPVIESTLLNIPV